MYSIVLVEPEIPQNTGNISRTCACTGASLHLVKPLGFTIDDSKLKRAGLDYWSELDLHIHESLADFLEYAKGKPLYFASTKAAHTYSEIEYPEDAFFVFGKETKGLPETLLHDNYENSIRIPMRTSLRSLNLSNSVAIVLYEALRQRDFFDLQLEGQLTQF
ncbi:MAG: tRNA (uridine(34)/cytosine(34)/5-carboxymethylaminomethyluridine(34)-2'-O)-methyltransferase TrmL [Ruminococcaceae bacterium]|nr:tRNA (uridine(34)/cytosine(34)/5-carboxymethylaminomethyluridine(34)-2'-O)-methyltransferase TrmL [Oscillospiraceae bacterium]